MIKADKTYRINGLQINEFFITQHNEYCAAAPLNKVSPRSIVIYSFPSVPIKSYISLAEFYSRQVYYNNFKGLIPNYIVDNLSVWHLQENISDKIIIIKCGDSIKAENKIEILCSWLSKEYNIEIEKAAPRVEFDSVLTEEPIEIIPRAASCTFEVYFGSKWQQPIKGQPIRAIKININEGQLYYRTHLINGGWLDWVGNNEISGRLNSFIDGFQVDYKSDKYQLFYCFSTINSKLISWHSTNIGIPTKQYLDNFDFKIELKEGV